MEWIIPQQINTPLVEWIYKTRGIEQDNIEFFNPSKKNLHSPLLLHNVEKAAETIKKYIGTKKKIYIHGDFDVDGITATSIMWQFLYRDMGLNALPYIPSRFTEGYGLSEESINKLLNDGAELIITVDCGVKDIELVNKYSDKVDFIITDHHTILPKISEVKGGKISGEYLISASAKAVCHPRLGSYPFHELCGAAVAWKVCSGINEILNLNINVDKYLDLVAIGTVCDVMPLVDENRTLLKLGLNELRNTNNLGIKSLSNLLNLKIQEIDTYHLGFIIGPRINATGRLEDAMDAVRLLTTLDTRFAQKMSSKLDSLNLERQQLTQKFIEIAELQINNQIDDHLFFVYGEDWPEGIIGLIAGKLTEKYHRPVIVASHKNERFKASARSIEEFHIANALSNHSALLLTHGGHAQAAGLSFEASNLEQLVQSLKLSASAALEKVNLVKKLKIDGIGTLEDVNSITYEKLNSLSPFGMANKKPVICFLDITPEKVKVFGKDNNHLKLIFQSKNTDIEALAFNNTEYINVIDFAKNIDIAGTIEKNVWNGKESFFIKIDDIRQSN